MIAAAVAVPMATASGPLTVTLSNLDAFDRSALAQSIRAHVSDATGNVATATVTYSFSSADGGTIVVGGETQPGGATPVTGSTDSEGHHDLTGIGMGKAGSVTVVATATTVDGRTATSNPVVVTIDATVGTLYSWGYNAEGQIGADKVGGVQTTPIARTDGRKYAAVVGSWSALAGIAADGHIYTAGNNGSGPLAMGWYGGKAGVNDGNRTPQAVGPAGTTDATGVGTPTGVLANVVAAYTGKGCTLDETFFVSTADGSFWGAGENAGGGFSRKDGSSGGTSDRTFGYTAYAPIGVEILAKNPGRTIRQPAISGWFRSAYLLDDGTVWNAGRNNYSAFGTGSAVADGKDTYAAQTVREDGSPLTGIRQIAITQRTQMYLDAEGKIWGSGTNSWGRMPGFALDAKKNFASRLTQPEGKDVRNLWTNGSDGGFYVAETVDGMLYAAGANLSGSASIGTTATNRMNEWIPVVGVPAGKAIVDIQFGHDGGLWLFDDGSVYFSGLNDTGGLGNGTANGTRVTTMTQVPIPGGKKAISIAATFWDSYAVVTAD
ncbi:MULTISPECIES: hypothetical protein [Bacteria]|uniref:hypothetical protein n=1 Tax=Bacteria TaxID=2 RepID=UPI003C7DD0D2